MTLPARWREVCRAVMDARPSARRPRAGAIRSPYKKGGSKTPYQRVLVKPRWHVERANRASCQSPRRYIERGRTPRTSSPDYNTAQTPRRVAFCFSWRGASAKNAEHRHGKTAGGHFSKSKRGRCFTRRATNAVRDRMGENHPPPLPNPTPPPWLQARSTPFRTWAALQPAMCVHMG